MVFFLFFFVTQFRNIRSLCVSVCVSLEGVCVSHMRIGGAYYKCKQVSAMHKRGKERKRKRRPGNYLMLCGSLPRQNLSRRICFCVCVLFIHSLVRYLCIMSESIDLRSFQIDVPMVSFLYRYFSLLRCNFLYFTAAIVVYR